MPQLLCPTLIGRDDEMSMLAEALERAIAGAGGVVVVIGEAGLGKSRIAHETVVLARQHAMPVLLGREVPGHRASSFRALSEALLAAFRTEAPPDDPDLEPFRRHLARLVPQWRSDRNEQAGPANELDRANDLVLAEGVVRATADVGRPNGLPARARGPALGGRGDPRRARVPRRQSGDRAHVVPGHRPPR